MDDLTEKELLNELASMRTLVTRHWKRGQYGLSVSDSDNARWERNIQLIEQAHTQLCKIVKEYFSDPNKKSLGKLAEEYSVPYSLVHAIDSRLAQDYEQADTDPVEVDEDIMAWIDESITVNKGIIEEDWVSAGRAKEELEILKRIKQLLTQKRTVTREWINELIGLAMVAGGTGDYKPLEKKLKELGMVVAEEEEKEQPPMDKETAGDMKYHALKDEDLLDSYGRRKDTGEIE